MKSAPANSPLDAFLKDALKTPDVDLHPIDWSEVEMLLRHEQKSISIGVSKKTILISVVAGIIITAAFGIIHIVQYYSVLPEENNTLIDPRQNSLSIIDTPPANVIEFIPSQTDTLKIDSFKPRTLSGFQTPNSVRVSNPDRVTPSDATSLKKTSDVQTYSFIDSAAKKRDSIHHRSKDTASASSLQEIKNKTPAPVDTTVKNISPLKNIFKNKKSKKQPLLQPENNPKSNLLETKSDSLKQP